MDRSGNGAIDDGSELFGSGTLMPDGTRAVDGFAALATLDTNNDGVVDTSAFSASGVATGTRAQLLYSASTGKLSYDADGTGAQQAQEFATLTANTSIWRDDILLKAA